MLAPSVAVAFRPEQRTDGDVQIPAPTANQPCAADKGPYQQDLRLRGLMRSAQLGDSRAYAELLGAITPRLRQIISHKRGFLQAADIEDLVQEILLSLHAVRNSYDPERPFMPWLMAIAQHRLADAGRRYYRQVARQNELDEWSASLAEDVPSVETEIYGNPEGLKQAIECLPPRQRIAIQLLKLREMSLKEAAEASGSSAGALRVSVHRAMTKLRQTLGADGRKRSSPRALPRTA